MKLHKHGWVGAPVKSLAKTECLVFKQTLWRELMSVVVRLTWWRDCSAGLADLSMVKECSAETKVVLY